MSSLAQGNPLVQTEAETLYSARAKYIQTEKGLRLISVCQFSHPVFNPRGCEKIVPEDTFTYGVQLSLEEILAMREDRKEEYLERATRRAKTEAFDLVQCNPDMDMFATLTFDPQKVNRCSYDDTYDKLKNWLSNRVGRKGLKYICVPEHHKDGQAIHFHMICNADGIETVDSGHKRDGKTIYNLKSWKWGFSTVIHIGESETDRDRVAKYVYKYMGKQLGQRIGGRYFLHGGKMRKPVYVYSNDSREFFTENDVKYTREKKITDGTTYTEWNFI